MDSEKYISLILHTTERAHLLRHILERHNIPVRLLPVSEHPTTYSIQVPEASMALAVKILESTDPYEPGKVEMKLAGMSENLLIPVDFSDYSMLAVKVGFELAKRLSLHPLLLHTYSVQIAGDNVSGLAEAMRTNHAVQDAEEKAFSRFVREVRKRREEGEFANVRFSTMLREGLPEEVIADYCRVTPPSLIVMATRGRSKKEAEIIGSVTAEVIDTCRVPVFTVPECYNFPGVANIKRLGFFCMLDRNDLFTMDALMRMFSYPEVDITLFPASDKANAQEKIEAEHTYYTESYPASRFSHELFPPKELRKRLEDYLAASPLELFVIPNKKSNVFTRLFNPGIAHRMLFERDIPMLVIPI